MLPSAFQPHPLRLSVLPSSRGFCRWRQGKGADALVDLSSWHILIFQSLDVGKDLPRAGGLGPRGTSQNPAGAGQFDIEESKVLSRPVHESGGDGPRWDVGRMSLGVGEGAVGADENLLAAGDDSVCSMNVC